MRIKLTLSKPLKFKRTARHLSQQHDKSISPRWWN